MAKGESSGRMAGSFELITFGRSSRFDLRGPPLCRLFRTSLAVPLFAGIAWLTGSLRRVAMRFLASLPDLFDCLPGGVSVRGGADQ